MTKPILVVLVLLLIVNVISISAAESPYEIRFETVTEDITLAYRPGVPRYPVVGNGVIVPIDGGVVLVDGGGSAAVTDQILAHIETHDLGPIKYVILSHWHSDHSVNIGNYVAKYPDAIIISHPWTKTRIEERLMDSVGGMADALVENTNNAREELRTGHVKNNTKPLSAMQRKRAEELVADFPTILAQKKLASATVPEIATRGMVLPVESRRIELIDLGCGNTPGDLVIWLPREKVLIGGDILTWPVPFGFPPCPSRTISTTERLLSFDFDFLILGHGPVQLDRSYGNKVLALQRHAVAEIYRLHGEGLGVDGISAELRLQPYDREITQGDTALEYFFNIWYRQQIVEWTIREIESK